MHDALHVRPGLHDLQVQQHFARPLLLAGELLAVHVDQADILRLQKALAVHRRRAQHFVLVEPHGDVAVVRRGKPALVNPVADLADGFLQFFDVLHLVSFTNRS